MWFSLKVGTYTTYAILVTICLLEQASSEEELFKINKLNLIWSKAQHSIGPTKLKDLKSDLTKHEFEELTLKKMKAHNQDKDGLFEASVRKKLLSIMTKYSLERYFNDIHTSAEKEKLNKTVQMATQSKSGSSPELKSTFRDKKLDKLWKKAEQSGFTQEQLMVLHEEFQHQQDKLDEHYETMNSIEQEIEERSKINQKLENSIDGELGQKSKKKSSAEKTTESPSAKKARLDSNVQQVLKDKYRDIKKNIDQLHKKIISGKIGGSEGPFEEPVVNELWLSALEANFTHPELESLQEELEHYEVRVKKLKHFQAQLERNNLISKDSSSNGEDDDPETKHIKRRVKELDHKVAKTHKSLEKKIVSKRDEL